MADPDIERWRGRIDATVAGLQRSVGELKTTTSNLREELYAMQRWQWKVAGACTAISAAAGIVVPILLSTMGVN